MLIEEDTIYFPEQYIDYLTKLQEVYTKTDVSFIEDMLEEMYDANTEEELYEIASKYNCVIEIIDSQSPHLFLKGGYGYELGKITFFFSSTGLQNFWEDANGEFDRAVFDLKRSLTHEDTHKQQDLKSKSKAFKSYKKLPNTAPEDPKEADYYFDQNVEADAYARQVGFQLRKKFPNLDAKSIFDKIKNNKINSQIISEYRDKDTDISEKNRRKFWHTLWQYLDNQEEELK